MLKITNSFRFFLNRAKKLLSADVVTLDDYLYLSELFRTIDDTGYSSSNFYVMGRYLKLVKQNCDRTCDSLAFKGSCSFRLSAFKSHNRISSLNAAKKSSTGRSGYHHLGRYSQGDFLRIGFGQPFKKMCKSRLSAFTSKRGASLGAIQ